MNLLTFGIPPLADAETRPFWEYASRGEFRMQACGECGMVRWPPGPLCPSCFSAQQDWREIARQATLQSWVVYRRQYFPEFPPPYVVALGTLDDGPRYTAALCSNAGEPLARGTRLNVVLRPAQCTVAGLDPLMLPVFEIGPT